MILVDETTVPQALLPIAQFKDHLRLGTGFSDETLQEDLLETCLRSALAAIEARTGKIILTRRVSLTLSRWRHRCQQPLPVAPVTQVLSLTLVDRQGVETVWPDDQWQLVPDGQTPRLTAGRSGLPSIPANGVARLRLVAGLAGDWLTVPQDLARAVLMLAAHFYEFRHDNGTGAAQFPAMVENLIAPYRRMRLFGGAQV